MLAENPGAAHAPATLGGTLVARKRGKLGAGGAVAPFWPHAGAPALVGFLPPFAIPFDLPPGCRRFRLLDSGVAACLDSGVAVCLDSGVAVCFVIVGGCFGLGDCFLGFCFVLGRELEGGLPGVFSFFAHLSLTFYNPNTPSPWRSLHSPLACRLSLWR